MAYLCINGWGKECDGCMKCMEIEEENRFEGICSECGADIYEEDNFKYIEGELFCEDCSPTIKIK